MSVTGETRLFRESEVSIDGIGGSLIIPDGGDGTTALIISGSGPSDRDGNHPTRGANNIYRMLAQSLAQNGIASLRYDKRGVGASKNLVVSEADLTIADFASDVTLLANWLAAQPFANRVVLIGHSEGSMLALMAQPRKDLAAIVSLTGAGRPLHDVLRFQLLERPAITPELAADLTRVLDALRGDTALDPIPAPYAHLFRESVRPFLRSVVNIDPAALLATRPEPVLIVGGAQDIQVTRKDFDLLVGARATQSTPLWIDDMTHILKPVLASDATTFDVYRDPHRPLSQAFIDGLIGWLMMLAASCPQSTSRASVQTRAAARWCT